MKPRSGEHNESRWATWAQDLMRPDDAAAAARRVGINRSTVHRWLTQGTTPDAEHAVKFARAYGASAIEALLVTGVIHPGEVDVVQANARAALRAAPDEALLAEIRERMNRGEPARTG